MGAPMRGWWDKYAGHDMEDAYGSGEAGGGGDMDTPGADCGRRVLMGTSKRHRAGHRVGDKRSQIKSPPPQNPQ